MGLTGRFEWVGLDMNRLEWGGNGQVYGISWAWMDHCSGLHMKGDKMGNI